MKNTSSSSARTRNTVFYSESQGIEIKTVITNGVRSTYWLRGADWVEARSTRGAVIAGRSWKTRYTTSEDRLLASIFGSR